ncbi:MAG: hypothetical protein O9295_16360 [Microcystis sp. LE18-22.4A]|nr:hypothetical protein [Microcystis sp. LE18-22.4A]MDJ0669964.1 hypothetical protein [Microcystis sp. M53598_WE2]
MTLNEGRGQEAVFRSQESGDRRLFYLFSPHPTPYTPHPTPCPHEQLFAANPN